MHADVCENVFLSQSASSRAATEKTATAEHPTADDDREIWSWPYSSGGAWRWSGRSVCHLFRLNANYYIYISLGCNDDTGEQRIGRHTVRTVSGWVSAFACSVVVDRWPPVVQINLMQVYTHYQLK